MLARDFLLFVLFSQAQIFQNLHNKFLGIINGWVCVPYYLVNPLLICLKISLRQITIYPVGLILTEYIMTYCRMLLEIYVSSKSVNP